MPSDIFARGEQRAARGEQPGRVKSTGVTEHDLRLVVIAGMICFLASFTAIDLFGRARALAGRERAVWLLAAGAATGCGIWATHFVAMLAYDPGVAIAYNVALTALSLVLAVIVTGVGLALAVQVQHTWSGVVGGCIVGAGVACMHYTGMWAVELPGHVTWSIDLVIVSVAVGMLLGAVALAIATRRSGIRASLWPRCSSRLRSCRITLRRWERLRSFPIRRERSPRCRSLRHR